MKYLKRFDEAFGQNGMFDWKVADMKHTPSSRAQLGLDKQEDELDNSDIDEEEKELFKQKWDNEKKEGTFAYYNSMTPEELRDLQKTFKHDFENPAQHDPKFVAYLKACELKKVFAG